MSRGSEEERLRLIKEFRDGPLYCQLFEARDASGVPVKVATFRRAEGMESARVHVETREVEETRRLIEAFSAEFYRGSPRQWYAVVRLTELTESGAKAMVLRSYSDLERAKDFRDRHQGTALFPGALAERPAKKSEVHVSSDEVEALERKGMGQDLARQLRFLRWKEKQGQYHNAGVWNDREEQPRVGQLVTFTRGFDYRGEPEPRRVEPLRPLDPGEPGAVQHVVFKMDGRVPGLAKIVSLPDNGEAAEAEVRRRDEIHRDRVDQRLQQRWVQFGATEELRRLANQEGQKRDETPASAKRPSEDRTESAEERLRIRTYVKGRARAEVIERAGEDGTKQVSVLLTRQVRDADGRTRLVGTVLSVEDLQSIRNALERNQEKKREATQLLEQAAHRQAEQQSREQQLGQGRSRRF